MKIVEETKCRVCKGELETVLDLGEIVPSAFLTQSEIEQEGEKAPLVLVKCKQCDLVQLRHTVDLDLMYRQYWYSSSLNKSMISSLQDIEEEIEKKIKLEVEDVVVDIGCNDGTMLNMYPAFVKKVGFDPALNLKHPVMDFFVNDYFTAKSYPVTQKAKVITAIAMFYDLPDPNKFLQDVREILREDGIFVIQFTDLMSMIRLTAFDNICHEHLEYYSLRNVYSLLKENGFDVIDVSYNDVNGGSVRITACHENAYPVSIKVLAALLVEEEYLSKNTINSFARRMVIIRGQVRLFLETCKILEKSVYLLGASTKGNTLLQYCGVTQELVPYAAEVNREKFGMYAAGSGIYIIPEEEAFHLKPDFFFVPIWHFKKSLLNNEKIRNYINSGGKLVFPLPEFHIVGKEDL